MTEKRIGETRYIPPTVRWVSITDVDGKPRFVMSRAGAPVAFVINIGHGKKPFRLERWLGKRHMWMRCGLRAFGSLETAKAAAERLEP